ncbi:alpha/beta hydrolase family protein, partial [Noviherbaspirillum denitrificans]
MATRDDTLRIAVDGGHIAGTLITPDTKLPGVLFVHGWGGSQEQYISRAREVAALGCVCLTFDLRGHAGTLPQHETVTRENNLHDVL